MKSDIVTRLLLETGQFDSNLKNSTAQIKNFTGGNGTGGIGAMVTGLKKLVPVIAGVTAAGGLLHKVLLSNQTTADMLNNSIHSATTTFNTFSASLLIGNYAVFEQGLIGMISRIREYSQALDDFEDSTLAFNFINDKAVTSIQELRTELRDIETTPARRNEIITSLGTQLDDLKVKTTTYASQLKDLLSTKYLSTTGLNITESDLERFFGLTLFKDPATMQAIDDYYAGLEKVKDATLKQDGGVFKLKQVEAEYQKANSEIYKQIVLNEENDESRKSTLNLYREQFSILKSITGLEKGINRDIKFANKPTVTTGNIVAITPVLTLDDNTYNTNMEKMQSFVDRHSIINKPLEIPVIPRVYAAKTKVNELLAKEIESGLINTDAIKNIITPQVGGATIEMLTYLSNIFGSLSTAANDADAAWINYVGNIISGVAQMLPSLASVFGITSALGIAEQAKIPFPLNLVAMAATGTALLASIASIPKFAEGGIVGGGSFAGDKVLARVNSGEMILNRTQQGNLFNILNGQGNQVEFVLRGSDLYGSFNNYTRRMSKL